MAPGRIHFSHFSIPGFTGFRHPSGGFYAAAGLFGWETSWASVSANCVGEPRPNWPTMIASQMRSICEQLGYAHFVPFLESDTEIFLKTIIPSRKVTKKYAGDKDEET